MDPANASWLWMGGFLLLVAGIIGTAIVVLRTPLLLLNLRTQVSALDADVVLLQTAFRKLGSRVGSAERKARTTGPGPPSGSDGGLEHPSPLPDLPLPAPAPDASREAQLAYAADYIRRQNGGS